MKKIYWALQAVEDLQEIYRFYQSQSDKVADELYRGIKREVKQLAKHPFVGPMESLLKNEREIYRSLLILDKFKVIYVVQSEQVGIAHVWDCSRIDG